LKNRLGDGNFDLAIDGAMNQIECLTPEVEGADQLVCVEGDGSPTALLLAVLADQAHGVGWLEATTVRVALTDRRELVHFPMGQQLLGSFIEQAVHVHACALRLAAHRFKDRVGNSDVVLHKRLVPIIAPKAIARQWACQ
jgi:hypothetical protein